MKNTNFIELEDVLDCNAKLSNYPKKFQKPITFTTYAVIYRGVYKTSIVVPHPKGKKPTVNELYYFFRLAYEKRYDMTGNLYHEVEVLMCLYTAEHLFHLDWDERAYRWMTPEKWHLICVIMSNTYRTIWDKGNASWVNPIVLKDMKNHPYQYAWAGPLS